MVSRSDLYRGLAIRNAGCSPRNEHRLSGTRFISNCYCSGII